MKTETHVVLGSQSPVKVLVEEGELLENIPAHTGNLAEEEESTDTSSNTERTDNTAAIPY